MNLIHLSLATVLVVPAMVGAGIYMIPSEADKKAEKLQAIKVAAVQRHLSEEKLHQIQLQPFFVTEGVFVIQLEARGEIGRSTLCGNLPLLHDAVVTELYGHSAGFSTHQQDQDLKSYAKNLRTRINGVFKRQHVNRVTVSFADKKNFLELSQTDQRIRQISSKARCETPNK